MTGQTIATGGGRYRVFVDDVEISAHTQQHTAQARLREETLKNLGAKARMYADFEYRYEPSDDELEWYGEQGDGATDPDPEPEPIPGDGLIPTQAETMKPGEWRNLMDHTNLSAGSEFQSFQRVHGTDGGDASADGIGWTQDLVYHKGKLLILAMRDRSPVALIGMEPDGTFWRKDDLPLGGGRRPFNRLAQDDEYLYYFQGQLSQQNIGEGVRTPLDNPGEFEKIIPGFGDDQADSVGNFSVTYVPDWGRFYAISPGGIVWSFAVGDSDWHRHGRTPYEGEGRVSGYTSAIVWNSTQKELVFVGGQGYGSPPGSDKAVARMTNPNGEIEHLPDLHDADGKPLRYTSAEGKLIVEPDGGYWLQVGRWDMYRALEVSGPYHHYLNLQEVGRPIGNYESYAPVHRVPGTDVYAFLSHRYGLVLHRLEPRS